MRIQKKHGYFLCITLLIIMLLFSCNAKEEWHVKKNDVLTSRDPVDITALQTDEMNGSAEQTDSDAPQTEQESENGSTTLSIGTEKQPYTDAPVTEGNGVVETEGITTSETIKTDHETKLPETKVPETKVPETKAPETKAPETKAPETKAPETKAPETKAPETKAPETEKPQEPISTLTDQSEKVSHYIYDRLTSNEQKQYNEIKNALLQNKSYCSFPSGYSTTKANKLIQSVIYDHPEIFWTSGSGMYATDAKGNVKTFEFQYLFSSQEIASIKNTLNRIKSDFLKTLSPLSTDYEKAIAVYRYINKNTTCDYASATSSSIPDQSTQTLYDALIHHTSVCTGYSKATQFLLQATGIEAVYVTGTANGGAHGWLLYQMNGTYYYMDPTWGDPIDDITHKDLGIIRYLYFAMTTDELQKTHSIGKMPVSLPNCSATKGSYYAMNQLLFTQYNKNDIQKLLTDALKKRSTTLSFRYSDSVSFRNAYQALANGDLSSIMTQAAASARISTSAFRLSWSYDEDYFTIDFYLKHN